MEPMVAAQGRNVAKLERESEKKCCLRFCSGSNGGFLLRIALVPGSTQGLVRTWSKQSQRKHAALKMIDYCDEARREFVM